MNKWKEDCPWKDVFAASVVRWNSIISSLAISAVTYDVLMNKWNMMLLCALNLEIKLPTPCMLMRYFIS